VETKRPLLPTRRTWPSPSRRRGRGLSGRPDSGREAPTRRASPALGYPADTAGQTLRIFHISDLPYAVAPCRIGHLRRGRRGCDRVVL